MDRTLYRLGTPGGGRAAVLVSGDRAARVEPEAVPAGAVVRELHNAVLLPGLADVHVHLREPGFSYKETIRTGTLAAARGGYTAVCAMPNLDPVPDSPAHLRAQTALLARDAAVRVYPYAALSVGERGEALAELEALAPEAVAFSDDGRGLQSEALMRRAMERARALGRLVAAHCEDDALVRGGYIHDGAYARAHGHRGVCAESEWRQLARDLRLAAETGCAYHVCHVSCRESVALIRRAKAAGVDVSCEVTPHHLLLDDAMLEEDGRFRMNPPLRAPADREALLEGLLDGTVDMIATDHAPHAAAEKAGGLRDSLHGVVGLETAFPVLYTGLVRAGLLPLERLVELMAAAPRRRFGLPLAPGDFTVFDLGAAYAIDPEAFLSKGRSSPFAGRRVFGRCLLTAVDGQVAYSGI